MSGNTDDSDRTKVVRNSNKKNAKRHQRSPNTTKQLSPHLIQQTKRVKEVKGVPTCAGSSSKGKGEESATLPASSSLHNDNDGFTRIVSKKQYKRDPSPHTAWKTCGGKNVVSATPVSGITKMQKHRKHIADQLNHILASKRAVGLTIDGSALSVNIAGLERQDAALTRAIAKGHYVVCIIGWYPASHNANVDTNANATTRSLKSHLWELLGCAEREALVYWADCWQFCHKSTNASMDYNKIKKFVAENIETQRLCADLLAVNIAIAEKICDDTITWVLNGEGETFAALNSIFPGTPDTGGIDIDASRVNEKLYSSNTDAMRKLYDEANGNLEKAIEAVNLSCNQEHSGNTYTVQVSMLQLHNINHKENVRVIAIHQHLSYHLMRHDASGKSPGLTLDADICDIILGGGCYNLRDVDTPKTMLVMIGRRLVAMLRRLDAITRLCGGTRNKVNALFQLKPSLLYMPGAKRAVKFLTDNGLLDLDKMKDIKTFSCGGFWSCANEPEAWGTATNTF